MPRNMRQKKRAERRVQAAASATAAASTDDAEMQRAHGKKLGHQVDENAMGDGEVNNNISNNKKDDKGINNNHNHNGDENQNHNQNNDDANANNNTNNHNGVSLGALGSSSNSSINVSVKKQKASRADPILASLSKNALRMSDVQLLHGPHWLNDAILNFYFAYLEEVKYKSNSDFLFITPEMSQCMLYMDDKELHSLLVTEHNAVRKPFIFMAMNGAANTGGGSGGNGGNRGGAQWTLLVASRPDKSFFHFDSYGGSNTESSMELVTNIKDVLEMRHARFRAMRCLQQTNGYDCGIHVICMADQLTDYVNRYDCVDGVKLLHQDVIKAKRNQLIKLIASLGQRIKY